MLIIEIRKWLEFEMINFVGWIIGRQTSDFWEI